MVNNIPNGKIKCIRIVNSARRVKVQFVVEEECDEIEKCAKPVLGIDLGVASLGVFDTGTKIAGRKRKLEKVKSRQREMNHRTRKRDKNREDRKRKTFRSKTYLKAQKALQKEKQRVKEMERGFLHEVTTAIVKENPNIAVEKLTILNMVKNSRLSRIILEQSWGLFVRMLEYKAERAGGRVVKVNPKNTSKACSVCGNVKEVLPLSEPVYSCSNCGFVLDRDHNAALNIANLASAGLSAGDTPTHSAMGFSSTLT